MISFSTSRRIGGWLGSAVNVLCAYLLMDWLGLGWGILAYFAAYTLVLTLPLFKPLVMTLCMIGVRDVAFRWWAWRVDCWIDGGRKGPIPALPKVIQDLGRQIVQEQRVAPDSKSGLTMEPPTAP